MLETHNHLLFQPVISVQGFKDDYIQLLKATTVDLNEEIRIPQAKMKDALKQHRDHFANYLIFHQPYELTDGNIEYIAKYINQVGFISATRPQVAEEEMPFQGISFHINYQSKVGQVLHMNYKGNSQEDFENHLRAHLKYTVGNLLSKSDKVFHMVINFTSQLQFGKALEVQFRNSLRPGIFYQGYFVIEKTHKFDNTAKL